MTKNLYLYKKKCETSEPCSVKTKTNFEHVHRALCVHLCFHFPLGDHLDRELEME